MHLPGWILLLALCWRVWGQAMHWCVTATQQMAPGLQSSIHSTGLLLPCVGLQLQPCISATPALLLCNPSTAPLQPWHCISTLPCLQSQ